MRNIQAVGDRPYITTAKGLGGWEFFFDVQYCIYAEKWVGGSEKVQNYADVTYG